MDQTNSEDRGVHLSMETLKARILKFADKLEIHTLTPGQGSYTGCELVCLHSTVPLAGYFTTDGTNPKSSKTAQPIIKHEHIYIISSQTIRVVTCEPQAIGFGKTIRVKYRIKPIPPPRFKMLDGDRMAINNVPPDCEAYFTYDGTNPTTSINARLYDNFPIPAYAEIQAAFVKKCYCCFDVMHHKPIKSMWGPVAVAKRKIT
jgi:hypothetical protein